MTATTNTDNLRLNKSEIFLIVEQVLAFNSYSNFVREVKISPQISSKLPDYVFRN